MIRSLLNIPRF
uniref:Uncharacterized protein n=1 Tax=Rhizophora mucronata TaxID=61149 RepID=A0A2P2INA2_RHIMU